MPGVRRLTRLIVRGHSHAAAMLHPIARVRQHHRRARRNDRERKERDDGTAEGVHEGTDHGRMDVRSTQARQEERRETSVSGHDERVRLDLDHHRGIDQCLHLEHGCHGANVAEVFPVRPTVLLP